jgi:hypothetical protein
MNVRRGIFRLWLVLSYVWLAIVGAMYWDEIQLPRLAEANYLYIEGADAFEKIPEHNSRSELRKTRTQVDFPNNVSLFTTPPQTDDEARSRAARFLIQYVEPRNTETWSKRRAKVGLALDVAMVPIGLSFALGAALMWAFSGFATRPKVEKPG